METEDGSPQGGNLSPLLANIYLNEFDQEFSNRGVPCIRYADDIVLLAKSKRASERLLESSTRYLEEKLKLTVNREKSRTVRCLQSEILSSLALYSKTKVRNLIKMGVPEDLAWQAGNSRRGYWFTTHTVAVNMAMTKERLISSGFYDLVTACQSLYVNY